VAVSGVGSAVDVGGVLDTVMLIVMCGGCWLGPRGVGECGRLLGVCWDSWGGGCLSRRRLSVGSGRSLPRGQGCGIV
jgi:hypothetical protein